MVVHWFVVLQLCKLLDLLLRFPVFLGLSSCHPSLTSKFPCCCYFSMVGVPASKFCCRPSLSVLLIFVPGNHASSYASCCVHSYFKNSNVEGFTIHRGVDAENAFILWVGKLRPPVVFLLSKFMVLFICVVSFVWFTLQCGFVFLSSTMGTRGD
jgi:hypothetical protein